MVRRGMWLVWLCALALTAARGAPAPGMEVEITGSECCGQALWQAIRLACAGEVTGLVMPSESEIAAGKAAWATARVREQDAGGGTTIREAPVRVHRAALENVPARRLFVSNAPERVPGPCTLFEGRVPENVSTRLLYHHLNDARAALTLAVELLNPSPASVRVQVVEAPAGPSTDEILVGHQAALAFANRDSRNAGFIATVPPYSAVTSIRTIFRPGETVSGLARFRVLSPGSEVVVRVRAQAAGERHAAESLRAYIPSSVFGDFQYDTTELVYHGTYAVGGSWLFVPLGGAAAPANRPGQRLQGSYGIQHTYVLTATNPLARAATVQCAVDAVGGVGRLVYATGGAWRETGLLKPGQPSVLATFTLAPGAQRTITLSAMPQSGSNYPMQFIMRSTQF